MSESNGKGGGGLLNHQDEHQLERCRCKQFSKFGRMSEEEQKKAGFFIGSLAIGFALVVGIAAYIMDK